jgi:hypothetical protein
LSVPLHIISHHIQKDVLLIDTLGMASVILFLTEKTL